VRCELRDEHNTVLADNVYWQAATDDDLGDPNNDEQFKTNLARWSNMSPLSNLPKVQLKVASEFSEQGGQGMARITLSNDSNHVAFFLRAEITRGIDGEEILPITYDDNYVTLFPHEKRVIAVGFNVSAVRGQDLGLRTGGYNVEKTASLIQGTGEPADRR